MTTLWQTLYNAKLVEGYEPSQKPLASPWYVKTLLAFTGWLAALFVLGFLAVSFNGLIDSEIALIILGIIMIILAYTILKKEVSDFVEHLALAISVAGQILIFIAFLNLLRESALIVWLILMVFQVFLALVIPNYIHRFFSSFMATYAFSFVLSLLGMPHAFLPLIMLLLAYIWMNEFHFKDTKKMIAIGYGVLLAFLYMQSSMLLHQVPLLWSHYSQPIGLWFAPWLGTLLGGMVMGYVVMVILKQYQQTLYSKLGLTLLIVVIFLSLTSLYVPALMTGLFILILGFYHSNKIILGLGIVSFLFALSSYYYSLNITLLEKAGILCAMGIFLLLLRWVILHILFKKEVENV